MNTRLPLFVAASALVAGVWCLGLASAAPTPPNLPKDSYKKATATDIAYLQQKLDDIVAEPAKNRGAIRTVKGVSLLVSVYADASKDDALKAQALKVYAATDKKDFKGAAELAKGLTAPKADPAAKAPATVSLEDIMSPFRVAKAGGLNIESDIKGAGKEGKIDAAAAELIGVRSAVIAEFAAGLPNDKASVNNSTKMKWDRYSKDMAATSKELTEEAAKGKSADEKKMLATLKRLDATCINCHNDFRNEP
ncbi:MAG TPA: cytochrome c [Gemmataceae bacterium]|nr:cytochrome c [Gemmataceae bacterium]